MKDAIADKIRALMQRLPLEDEPSVVYLLVEIRKYLEQDQPLAGTLPTLAFYCDWVLHHELDRGPAQRFLQAIYPLLEWREGKDAGTIATLDGFMTLGVFRSELEGFLGATNLSTAICSVEPNWLAFLAAYSQVVKDCKLIVAPRSIPPDPKLLDFLPFVVDSICIEPLQGPATLLPNRPFPMKWSVAYRHKDSASTKGTGEFLMTTTGVQIRSLSI